MINNIDEVLIEIKNENLREHKFTNVELKRSWDNKYGEKISALANKLGNEPSWMVIGIENNGKLAEQSEHWAIEAEEKISQHININLDPVQACAGMKIIEIKGSWIIIIKIVNPGAVVNWNHKAYKRTGTTSQIMKPEEMMELTIQLPGLTDFSKQKWSGDINRDLTDSFIRNLHEIREDISFDRTSMNFDDYFRTIKIKDTNTIKILFGDCKYRVVFYDKEEEPVKNENRFGLYGILTDSFIKELQTWACFSVDNPFPPRALREALANAVAHSSYFENDGDIIIEVFLDKIMISNICLRESLYFANRWFSRSHKTINGLLMETLRLAGLVDELGRGKNLIFSDSIKEGKRPPFVAFEKAGKYERWRLTIYGGTTNKVQLKLYNRIKELYPNEQKALIAYALILWREEPVSTIRNYIDCDSVPVFAEVLKDLNGPIFYYQKDDKIVLNRWARIVLEEGKDSKSFTVAEEEQLYNFAYDIQTKYHDGFMTSKEFRDLAHMGDTRSEITLCSILLKKWVNAGKLNKVKKGTYKFIKKVARTVELSKLMELFSEKKI